MNKHPVWRLRILYVFMLILVVISVVPLSFYGIKMMQTNQDTLKTQEQVLQTITSKSLAQEIGLYMDNTDQRLKEFYNSVQTLVAKLPASNFETDPALRSALESFPTDQPEVIFVTVVNTEGKGPRAGSRDLALQPDGRHTVRRHAGDVFLHPNARLGDHRAEKSQRRLFFRQRDDSADYVVGLAGHPFEPGGRVHLRQVHYTPH